MPAPKQCSGLLHEYRLHLASFPDDVRLEFQRSKRDFQRFWSSAENRSNSNYPVTPWTSSIWIEEAAPATMSFSYFVGQPPHHSLPGLNDAAPTSTEAEVFPKKFALSGTTNESKDSGISTRTRGVKTGHNDDDFDFNVRDFGDRMRDYNYNPRYGSPSQGSNSAIRISSKQGR